MIPAIGSALSGINHGLAVLDRAAHNIANQNTEGFRRHEVVARESESGGVESATVPAEGGGLVEDLVSMIIAKHGIGANSALIRRADEAVGSLIDIVR